MRLIDADKLKEKLTRIRNGIVNKEVARGSTISYVWEAAYLLIFDEYIKILDQAPTIISNCDCGCDCDCDCGCNEMTRDEIWSKVIQDLKTLDQEAHNEKLDVDCNAKLLTGLLVMTALQLHANSANESIKQEDKSHMWDLIDDLGSYSIKGETIMYLPEYQELTILMRKVL